MTEDERALQDAVLILQLNMKGLETAFVDFREETRDELKWLRRMLIGTLASAVLASVFSSVFVVVTR